MAQPNRNPPRGNKGKPLRDYLRAARPTEREIALILRQASEEAERIILQAMATPTGSTSAQVAQLRIILDQMQRAQGRMWQTIGESVREGISDVMTTAYLEAEDVLFRYLSRHRYDTATMRATLVAQARRGMEAVFAKAANDIPLADQVYRTGVLATGQVSRVIQSGMLLQKSAKQLARDVKKFINPSTPGGVSYAAFRLARTELNNAFKTAQEERYVDEPWTKGMRWNLSGSHPVPDICNLLAEEDRHELGAGIYPVGQRPNSHPNCLCFLTAEQIGEDEFIEGLLNGDYDDNLGSNFGEAESSEIIKSVRPTPDHVPEPAVPPVGIGKDITELDWDSIVKTLPNTSTEGRDYVLEEIARRQGFDALPMRTDDLSETVDQGGVEIFRGADRSHMEAFLNGEYFGSTGFYGNGIYFSNSREYPESFISGKGNAILVRAALAPGAKIGEYRELNHTLDDVEGELPEAISADLGRYAAAKGYDAIRRNRQGEVWYIVFNRGAIVVEQV